MLKLSYIDAATAQSRRTGSGCRARLRHHQRRRGALRGGNGARRSRQPLRRRCGQLGLQGLHDHRRPAADRRRPRGAHRPDSVRSPPRLSRPAQADEPGAALERRAIRCAAGRRAGDRRSVARSGGVGRAAERARLHPRAGLCADRVGWAVVGASGASRIRAPATPPKRAEEVVQRGDVVYVVTNGEGAAQLAQLPEAQSALVALDPNDGAIVGAGRRLRLLQQQVQSRDPGAPPAGIRIQAVPLFRGAREWLHALEHRHGRADRVRRQRPGEDLAARKQ